MGPMKLKRELSVFLDPGVCLELPRIGFGVRHSQKIHDDSLLFSPLTSMNSHCLLGNVPWARLFPLPEPRSSRAPH